MSTLCLRQHDILLPSHVMTYTLAHGHVGQVAGVPCGDRQSDVRGYHIRLLIFFSSNASKILSKSTLTYVLEFIK